MQLTLIRHAKSAWDEPELDDFDRPLDRRGLRDAPVMAQLVADRQQLIDVILCSSARRTRLTAQYFVDALGCEIEYVDALYSTDPRGLLELVAQRPETHVAVVAHDPTLTILARHYAPHIAHMPTCAIAHFTWSARTWAEALRSAPDAVQYDIPRDVI